MRSAESIEHKAIKELLVAKLKEWFGASIPEYYSVGHELDVFAVTKDGTSIYVEIVWSASKTRFLEDINMIQKSDAEAKVMIGSPQVIANDGFKREFDKVVMAQRRAKNTIHPMILDGIRILNDAPYVDTHLRKIFEDLVYEAREKKTNEKSLKDIVDKEGIDVVPENDFTKAILRYGRNYLNKKYGRLDVPLTKEMRILVGVALGLLSPLLVQVFLIVHSKSVVDIYGIIIPILLVVPSAFLFSIVEIIRKRKCTKCNKNFGISRVSRKEVSRKEAHRTDSAIHMEIIYRSKYKCEFCGDIYIMNERVEERIPLHDNL